MNKIINYTDPSYNRYNFVSTKPKKMYKGKCDNCKGIIYDFNGKETCSGCHDPKIYVPKLTK